MPKDSTSSASEWIQIAVLAGLFTAAGFALVTLVLTFFLNTSEAEKADIEARRYEQLVKLVSSKELKTLRHTAKTSEEGENAKDLRMIISEALTSHQLTYSDFARPTEKQQGRGTLEITVRVALQPARMSDIIRFIGEVENKRKSISVSTVRLTPDRKAQAEGGDSWTCTVEFVDYVARSA